MRVRIGSWFAAAVVVAATLAAETSRAELDVTVASGDVVRGSLLPASEAETFRVACPQGARLRASLRSGKARSKLVLSLADPAGAEIVSRSGRAARIAPVRVAASGDHAFTVRSLLGATSDDYTFSASWRTPRRAAGPVTLPASGVGEYSFGADADASVTIRLQPVHGSAASPSAVRVEGSRGSSIVLPGGPVASFRVPDADTYTVLVENRADAAGDVRAVATIRRERTPRRQLRVTTREIPSGTNVVAAVVMDRLGGRLDAPAGASIEGARVEVPEDALPAPAIVVLGTSSDLAPPKPADSIAATPAVVVGPFDQTFAGDALPEVTVSYAATEGPPENHELRVFAAGRPAAASPVSGAAIDVQDRVVSFAAARFARFQAFYVRQPDVAPPFALSGATDEELGRSVAVSGKFVYAGAPGAAGPSGEVSAGAVRIFEEVGGAWIERATLFEPSPKTGDRFGERIAVARGTDGTERLFVAAPGHAEGEYTEQGAVHVFTGSGAAWTPEASLVPPTSEPGWGSYGRFALDGLTVGDDDTFAARVSQRYMSQGQWEFTGNATFWLCRRDTGGWTFAEHKTGAAPEFPSAIRGGEWFSYAWSKEAVPAFPDGVLHELIAVYDAPGASWTGTARITQTAPALRLDQFGVQVAVDGDTFASCAWGMGSDRPSEEAYHTSIPHGRIYFGRRGAAGWEIDARIDVPYVPGAGPTPWDRLGPPVALHGDVAVAAVGSSPRARVYRRTAGVWAEALQLDASEDLGENHWYSTVALDGPRVVLGAGLGQALPVGAPSDTRGGIAIWNLPEE